ncbi:hypothetical protein DNH61_14465 [Paenibacillus sambharensis]|uniref:DUF2642 domain-containing protein n=1 Tax=Paenibacillus sambharensis TaxID=1803190 RepID=A0A2W1LKU0_9BACL|nr:hypothetical protein [Paenibacillus sambharensis]PZD95094.1 hypothetical protein DNH61_14465 [Paenibacillus sambharensis]
MKEATQEMTVTGKEWLQCQVELQLAGAEKTLLGTLAELGTDMAVVVHSSGKPFYVPLPQIRRMKLKEQCANPCDGLVEKAIAEYPDLLGRARTEGNAISYRKMLLHAKGMFTEAVLNGANAVLSGYLSSIMNDYLVFYSPVWQTVMVRLDRICYISPFREGAAPFNLPPEQLPLRPSSLTLARAFEQQLQKMAGRVVSFNLDTGRGATGMLIRAEDKMIWLCTVTGRMEWLHASSISSVHLP